MCGIKCHSTDKKLHVDDRIPVSWGGPTEIGNLVTLLSVTHKNEIVIILILENGKINSKSVIRSVNSATLNQKQKQATLWHLL